jgi:HD-GYP domain-containing protein (c-di-GMP phosphodiesterase class II)
VEVEMLLQHPEGEPVGNQLSRLHHDLRSDYPGVERLAIALYDAETHRLRTFAHSTVGETPLTRYEMPLAEMPYLEAMAREGSSRVIDDLAGWPGADHEHTRRLLDRGYRASLTSPLFEDGALVGFLFYDSAQAAYFDELRTRRLGVYTQLAATIVTGVLSRIRMLRAAVRATRRIGGLRDEETGAHLERMSRYARLIALGLAVGRSLDDEYIAFLTQFAPLHDIGKIGIPDRILLKPERLDPAEFSEMQKHVEIGKKIIDLLAEEFGLTTMPHVTMLRNLVLYHHEADDGSGYPNGLAGHRIPLEARIVRVADVFDALTSERPYKKAWTVENALTFLSGIGRSRFDTECVSSLAAHRAEVAALRDHFVDAAAGNGHEGYSSDL